MRAAHGLPERSIPTQRETQRTISLSTTHTTCRGKGKVEVKEEDQLLTHHYWDEDGHGVAIHCQQLQEGVAITVVPPPQPRPQGGWH